LVMFVFVACGFTTQDLRQAYAVLPGLAVGRAAPKQTFASPDEFTARPSAPRPTTRLT